MLWKAWIATSMVGAVVVPANVSHAGVRVPIPDGCDPTVVVGRAPHSVCKGGVEGNGFSVQPLYDCDTVESIAVTLKGADALVDALERTVMIERSDGGKLTESDLKSLVQDGYADLAPTCDITAMGAPDGDSSRDAFDSGSGEYDRWQMVETGALDVVTYFQENGLDLGADFQHPVVAVIDSGVDPVAGDALLKDGWAYPECKTSGETPCWWQDEQGHGTSVAFLVNENAGGLADILSIRVLDERGIGTQKDLAMGILEALAMGADVLNLSLAWPVDDARDDMGFPWYMAEVFAVAAGFDVPSFVAAGNRCRFGNGTDCGHFFPAEAPSEWQGYPLRIVSVGGTRPDGSASSQSVENNVDVWAPSEFICAMTTPDATVDAWQRLSGTSFAVPQLSGSLALLEAWQSLTREPIPATELEKALLNNEDDGLSGRPRLNLCATMETLGVPVQGCLAWSGLAAPLEGGCHEASGESEPLAAPVSATAGDSGSGWSVFLSSGDALDFTPVDLEGDAFWCAEAEIHEQPDIPTCTSCDYCRSEHTNSTVLELRVHLRHVPLSLPHLYLRLSFDNTSDYTYLELDDSVRAILGDGAPSHFLVFQLTASGAWSGEITEVWLVGSQGNQWSGQPLLDVGTTTAQRTVTRCD